jgi:thioredoxin-related protein
MVPLHLLWHTRPAEKVNRWASMMRLAAIAFTPVMVITSCGLVGGGDGKEKKEANPFGPTGIPPMLRRKGPEGTAVTPGGNNPGQGLTITPEEDLVFTDPDNPDAGIPELSSVLSAPKKGPWEESESIARRKSYREGKPLLIFFTDSMSNPMCKALDDELFSRHDFGNWANEKLIRYRVDVNERVEAESLGKQVDLQIRTKTEKNELKKRYKVLGHPTLIVLNPSGEVIGRYRGYQRGQADFTWGQLKHAEIVSTNSNQQWRKDLEKKGYREWQDNKSRKVFARLVSYSKGELVLVEPDGFQSKTHENRLSDEDQSWIKRQKEIRGIR